MLLLSHNGHFLNDIYNYGLENNLPDPLDLRTKKVYTIGVVRDKVMPLSSPLGVEIMEKKVTKSALVEFLRKMLTSNEKWAQAALLRSQFAGHAVKKHRSGV